MCEGNPWVTALGWGLRPACPAVSRRWVTVTTLPGRSCPPCVLGLPVGTRPSVRPTAVFGTPAQRSGFTRSLSCSLGRIRAVMGNDFGFFLSSEGKRCVLSRQSVFWTALGLLLLGPGCLIVWLCCYSVCFIIARDISQTYFLIRQHSCPIIIHKQNSHTSCVKCLLITSLHVLLALVFP